MKRDFQRVSFLSSLTSARTLQTRSYTEGRIKPVPVVLFPSSAVSVVKSEYMNLIYQLSKVIHVNGNSIIWPR